jgi:hypothetical protein
MKWILVLLLVTVFLVGCEETAPDEVAIPGIGVADDENTTDDIANDTTNLPGDIENTETNTACVSNSECTGLNLCVDGSCRRIDNLYSTEGCTTTCRLSSVDISTNDGSTESLSPGQGSYSYAGALEWKTMSIPAFCEGEDISIPLKIIKKSTGRILSEEVLTLKRGQTSAVVGHPLIARVAFTATLDDYEVSC